MVNITMPQQKATTIVSMGVDNHIGPIVTQGSRLMEQKRVCCLQSITLIEGQ
jgi:hypothetical protein